MTFALHSPAFQNGGAIPDRYVRDDQNLSPPLRWSGAPAEAKSFMLVVEDPDAPGRRAFYHWALHGIGANQSELREGLGAEGEGVRQAINDFGKARYDGPQPPAGPPHHYHFKLAALDVANLEAPEDASAADVWNRARPHVIDEAEIVGVFQRG